MKEIGPVLLKSLRASGRVYAPIAFVLLAATALFMPWWATLIVVAALRLFLKLSIRFLSFLGFAAWAAACFARDLQGHFGPSRFFAKLFSLNSLGLGPGSPLSRLIVYVVIGVIGLMLAFLTAGLVKSTQALVSNLGAGTSAD